VKPKLFQKLIQNREQRLAFPSITVTLVLLVVFVLTSQNLSAQKELVFLLSTAGAIYAITIYLLILPDPKRLARTQWIIALINGLGLGLIYHATGSVVAIIVLVIIVVGIIQTGIIAGRKPSYILIGSLSIIVLLSGYLRNQTIQNWIQTISLPLGSLVIAEIILRLLETSRKQIRQLEIINSFAQQITSSIEPDELIEIVSQAIQNAMSADTYFIGQVEGDEIVLNLFFDDGEYFTDTRAKMDGTLAGWVIRNRMPLFIPDLRKGIDLEGVEIVIIGKEQTSLSWVGVPMITDRVKGVIALASYTANAFDQSTLEVLENLGQLAAMSLHNTYHHAEVERQSRMDSLTDVLNHGAFLETLQKYAERSDWTGGFLSLIMLDVDFFKKYNDTYGHQFGDKVLTSLAQTIKSHIKSTDAVGRWGGEEFAVALPNTAGNQAMMVARRIQETMNQLILTHAELGDVPGPTVSQGIAEYPSEANDIYDLVDVADKRLYDAKERGRNQIEPQATNWEKTRPLPRKKTGPL